MMRMERRDSLSARLQRVWLSNFCLHASLLRPAPGGLRRIMMMNMSACLFVRPLAYLGNHTAVLYRTIYIHCLWTWLGDPLVALRYVMYFRFCG